MSNPENKPRDLSILRNNAGAMLCEWGKDGNLFNQVGTAMLAGEDPQIDKLILTGIEIMKLARQLLDNENMTEADEDEIAHLIETGGMLADYMSIRETGKLPEELPEYLENNAEVSNG